MKAGGTKLFKNKEKLYSMVNLRRNGWALTSLGLLYGCDISSVSVQCKKYGISPLTDEVYTIERIATHVLPKLIPESLEPRWRTIKGERFNRGRSYRDYFTREIATISK